jgi:hypothetical protein
VIRRWCGAVWIVARRRCRQPPARRRTCVPIGHARATAVCWAKPCFTKNTIAEATATASFGAIVMHRQSANDDRRRTASTAGYYSAH